MRRNRRKITDDDDGVDMTPMLDIVFIMLIFFIVTATFLNETGLDFTRPPDGQAQANAKPKPVIPVYVNEQSLCAVDGVQKECSEVAIAVEGQLANKPGATVLVRVHYAADHYIQVMLKDVFDGRDMKTKFDVVGRN